MFKKPRYFLSTAIPYTNSTPHIGFAMELILTDALARYLRINGKEVFFSTGVDQHGQKNKEKALENNTSPLDFTNKMADKFLDLNNRLNISYTKFVRTVDDYHKKASQKLWSLNYERDLIYKDIYSGLYCVGCEEYKLDKDLTPDGLCPDHKKPPIEMESENYFFKLSDFSRKIEQMIESDKMLVKPETRKNEMLNICKEGLRDFSISRTRDQLDWGVDVPNDKNHVMYVWFDALTNYISALGFDNNQAMFEKWWENDDTYKIHIIGKGIHRFHLAYWPGMLLGAGLKTQNETFIHGFITSGGTKMSKSLGNVVDPFEYVEKYGTDAMRWYLMSQANLADDMDFTKEKFAQVYESDLRNGLGNILNRVLALKKKVSDIENGGEIKTADRRIQEILSHIKNLKNTSEQSFFEFNYKRLTDESMLIVQLVNQYFDSEKPWTKDQRDISHIFSILANILSEIFFALYPIIPSASKTAFMRLSDSGSKRASSCLSLIELKDVPVKEKSEGFLFEKI